MAAADVIAARTEQYYTGRLREFGPTPRGVDWKDPDGQLRRFAQLLKLPGADRRASILDYGCGYGALGDELRRLGYEGPYLGFDLSMAMVEAARSRHADDRNACFADDPAALGTADYAVASGPFNVKLETPEADWEAYVHGCLDELAALGRLGFAFNLLTSYSDLDRRRPDLYYADPCEYFRRCKARHGRDVALLHDYGLYEFTILVRK